VKVCFTEDGWDDYRYWVEADRTILARINILIEDACRNLFKGLGKPEPLRGDLAGWWSRRISGEHRLVYRITGKAGTDQRIEVAMCRHHYG
jgi:toxin YoeB